MFGAGRLGSSNKAQAPQMDLTGSSVSLFAENPGMGQVLSDVLEVLGACVKAAPLAEGPTLVDTDLVVVEGSFEEARQFDLVTDIRECAARFGVPSLVLSASHGAVAGLKVLGVDKVMTLPLSLATFIAAVGEMVGSRKQGRAIEAAD